MRAKRTILELLDGQQRFGRLTVLGEAEPYIAPNGNVTRRALCQCNCGTERLPEVPLTQLRHGGVVSCGCFQQENKKVQNLICGVTPETCGSPEHVSWKAMIRRCYDVKQDSYDSYGGRGIEVCQAWRESFPQFLKDVGPRPAAGWTLDRREVDGHYEPGNVRWATTTTQTRNTRRAEWITIDGTRMLVADACELFGINTASVHTLSHRTGQSKAGILSEYLDGRRKVRKRRG